MDMQSLRERIGLKTEDISSRLGISANSVRNWETGRTEPTMTPEKYEQLLEIYQCSPRELTEAVKMSMSRRHIKRKPGRKPKPKEGQII